MRRRSEPRWDISQNRVDVHFRVAITDKTEGRSYDLDEIHPMRYLFLPEIELIGQETGFAFAAAEEFVTGAPPSTGNLGRLRRAEGGLIMRYPSTNLYSMATKRPIWRQCIDTGWISSEGPFVTRLEEEFARRVGRAHAVAVCNGSAALDLAVAALGIGPGDEVILPAFTIISCAAAVVRAGAKPVVVDCEPDTWNVSAAKIAERITARTKAIMVVHIYGLAGRHGSCVGARGKAWPERHRRRG